MYEITQPTGQYCIECNKELGYLDPEIKTFYRKCNIQTQYVFSNRNHIKFNKKRQRCFDCAFEKFGNLKFRPNVHHSDYTGYLFDVEVDKSISSITLENMIKKYGEEEGTTRFDQYKQKQAYSNSYEYKKQKYGWTEEQFNEFNKKRAVTLENLIKKHGTELGTEKYNSYCKQQAYTNTEEYFVEKYGIERGKEEYARVCKEKAITLENMIRIHGEQEGTKKYNAIIQSRASSPSIGYSEISQELFWKLDSLTYDDTYFAEKNYEYYITHNNVSYLYDYTVMNKRKIIEFNGDYWHANPTIYANNWINPTNNMIAESIWKKDKYKNDLITQMGYSVLVIWENEYVTDKDEVIKRCLDFINEN